MQAGSHVGARVQDACDAFVQRLVRGAMTHELSGLARSLETASGIYIFTDDTVAQITASHGS
jgi:hypothetical protein